ncbi:MAG TPA: 4-hydroxy-3-methylbut-2-enyl diphosphate reductase [Bacteroidales bacterium]|nr:4-hydroxy-3-methylbut-2-enyl diphosphate reductase [Bacteroidales bacterium]
MKVDIDEHAGFCFGVVEAIRKAEEMLDAGKRLYCLGQMVHNEEELKRLEKKGLRYVSVDDFPRLTGETVLIRAHGEPPSTYSLAEKYDINMLEATCPIVLKLQERIRREHEQEKDEPMVIFGKANHPESIGLKGQANGRSIVVENEEELASQIHKVNLNGAVSFYSQTTMDSDRFDRMEELLKQEMKHPELLKSHNTICGQMKRRKPALKKFASNQEVVVFVSGKKSSNGKFLYSVAKAQNPRTYFVSSAKELKMEWFLDAEKVGVSGATSTPQWLLNEVAEKIRKEVES